MKITDLSIYNLQNRKEYGFDDPCGGEGVQYCESFLRHEELPSGIYLISTTDKNLGIMTVEKPIAKFIVGYQVDGAWKDVLDFNVHIDDLKDVRIDKNLKMSMYESKMTDMLMFIHERGFLDLAEVYYKGWNKVGIQNLPPNVKFQWF